MVEFSINYDNYTNYSILELDNLFNVNNDGIQFNSPLHPLNINNNVQQLNPQPFLFNVTNNNLRLSMFDINLNSHNSLINILSDLITDLETDVHTHNLNNNVVVTLDENDLSKLKKRKLDNQHDNNCTICMSTMDKDEIVTELNCSHTFHTSCIEPYFTQYNYKCPVCRVEVGKPKYNL